MGNYLNNFAVNPGRITAPACGDYFSSVGSGLFTVNRNSKSVTANLLNPYRTAESATPTNNVIPLIVPPDCTYLDLYHLFAGTSNPTTPLKVRVFGFAPTSDGANPGLGKPSSYNAAFDNLNGYWLPLEDPTTRETSLAFDNTPEVVQDYNGGSTILDVPFMHGISTASIKSFSLSKRRSIFLAGSSAILVHIEQAADQSGAGLVVARFVS